VVDLDLDVTLHRLQAIGHHLDKVLPLGDLLDARQYEMNGPEVETVVSAVLCRSEQCLGAGSLPSPSWT